MRLVTAALQIQDTSRLHGTNPMAQSYAASFELQETATGRVKLQKLELMALYQNIWTPRTVQRR
jgi:hypothetical protein